MRLWPSYLMVCLLSSLVYAQDVTLPTRHVSSVAPSQSPHREFSAMRATPPDTAISQPHGSTYATSGNNWQLLATLSQTLLHDISFATPLIGYAAGEHGQVWKTTTGGKTWTQVLNGDTNDYFYGVNAVTATDVVISGFYDSVSTQYGVFRWTHDGGKTWTADLSSGPTSHLRVRFAKPENGIIMNMGGGNSPTTVEYTTDGGASESDWTQVEANADGGWFDPQFSFLPDLHARASGINFCTSLQAGSTWTCKPSVDSVFDGPVFFLNDTRGWVGGGEISPNVEGWIHLTTNGGKTWSGRTLDGPWPIRSIQFLNTTIGWASGGNFYTGVGGVYFSSNIGQSWSVDLDSGAEMGSCAVHAVGTKHQIWCAGFMGNPSVYSSVIYSVQY
jgi:photosystem II stability/assembly factor-like uncharacterized protein